MEEKAPMANGKENEMLHHHEHMETKSVLNRLAKLTGHLESVRRMVEDGRDCSEVLIQLSAVRSALTGVSKLIMKDHMEHCIVAAVKNGDEKAVKDLCHAIDHFIK